jgi:hypothetical protein
MPPVTLWRISNSSWITADSIVDAPSLALGLRAHLLGDELCSAVVQIGPGQRGYLALHGCEGCAHSRCLPGCRVELMRRTLRATMGEGTQLTIVRRGLDPLGYQRFLWAWPLKRDAQPLSGEVLAGWPRARMVARWCAGQERWDVGAVIALGGEAAGPDVAPRLRECGWSTQPIPRLLTRWASDPFGLLLGLHRGRWQGEPWLLLPAQAATVQGTSVQDEPAAVSVAEATVAEVAL